ncbi:hypothetical protein QR77_32260 [Streptomyces sp. 150FB]|nr:hypothetical protein QR77_32260 [Streptomyces sp. 150FB]
MNHRPAAGPCHPDHRNDQHTQGDDPVRFASVAVLAEGGYAIVRRDTSTRQHDITASNPPGRMALLR